MYPERKLSTECTNSLMQSPTITERLKSEKERLEQRLKAVNEALAALKSNPEIALVVETISKVTY